MTEVVSAVVAAVAVVVVVAAVMAREMAKRMTVSLTWLKLRHWQLLLGSGCLRTWQRRPRLLESAQQHSQSTSAYRPSPLQGGWCSASHGFVTA